MFPEEAEDNPWEEFTPWGEFEDRDQGSGFRCQEERDLTPPSQPEERKSNEHYRPTLELVKICQQRLHEMLNGTMNESEWNALFGAKESAISAMIKLIKLQTELRKLMAEERRDQRPDGRGQGRIVSGGEQTYGAPLTDADWDVMRLAVEGRTQR